MANDTNITPEMLRKLLRYEPETGKLFWRARTPDLFEDGKRSAEHLCANWNSRWAGKEAFTSGNGNGYKSGHIFSRKYKAHRVIWAIFYGAWPEHQIDHKNGVRSDNRISEMRSVTPEENSRNQKMRKTNTSGHMGVQWVKRDEKWRARINVDGKRKELGDFTNKDDAIAVRKAAEVKYGYHPNHGRD